MNIAIVLPTYNESETLPIMIASLLPYIGKEDVIIIADDSQLTEREKIVHLAMTHENIILLPGELKAGRGAAVWRGMDWALRERPNLTHFLEADCDGSHRVDDILDILNLENSYDFVIGSRYLDDSKIMGWSFLRRVLSRLLNLVIPRLLGLPISDITNGLRRYSKKAALILVSSKPSANGFMYLSEQALLLSTNHIYPIEAAIHFQSRIAGRSSVTYRELLNSTKSLLGILRKRNELRRLK